MSTRTPSKINPLASLYSDLITIIENSVIKYSVEAEKNETLEVRKYSDRYLDALSKKDSFHVYEYTTEEYNTIGIHDQSIINYYLSNPYKVPKSIQTQLLDLRRKTIIETYEEPNDYYRTLNGLPELKDKEFIYINDELIKEIPELESFNLQKYGFDSTIPIHQLSDKVHKRYINILETLGVLDIIYKHYPDKEYIKYLGVKRIDIAIARRAKNFSLLYIPPVDKAIVVSQFKLMYEQARTYFVNTIYIFEYRSIYEYYDNFIALCIMVMAIQQLFARTITLAIDREFFDDYMVQLLYSVYGVPYSSKLPYNLQRNIVQNLNLLVQNKATNKVIYDIAYLLGFHRVDIYKYYLVKDHVKDADGIPLFFDRVEVDEEGNEKIVPDVERMYDVYFQKVDLMDTNYSRALMDTSKKVGYDSLTADDPYWWEDDALWEEIYEREFNYAETKYLGMTIQYKLSELMFNNVVLLRMILDRKDELGHVEVSLPRVTETDISLFETIIFLCACICKKNDLSGNILTDVSKILHVEDTNNSLEGVDDVICNTLGFNFAAVSSEVINPKTCDWNSCPYFDFENPENRCKRSEEGCLSKTYFDRTTEEVFKYFTQSDKDKFMEYFDNIHAVGVDEKTQIQNFNKLYQDVLGSVEFITKKMSQTQNYFEYKALKNLYDAIFVSQENDSMFTLPNGKPAKSYIEYLEYYNPELHNLILTSDDIELYQIIEHTISRLQEYIGNLDTLYLMNDSTTELQNYLVKLVMFFKSYTTDLLGMNILYVFNMKPENIIKMIDKVYRIIKKIGPTDKINFAYMDYAITHALYYPDDKIEFNEKVFLKAFIECEEPDKLIYDDIHLIKHIAEKTKLKYFDTVLVNKSTIHHKESLSLKDKCIILNTE